MIIGYEERYRYHLRLAMGWIETSIRPDGGSAAHLAISGQWSKAYPETSGYIINTLLEYAAVSRDTRWVALAEQLGDWLLGIQMENGAWAAGVHPSSNPEPSVFNTGQIIQGLAGLYRECGDNRYLDSLARAAQWLAAEERGKGSWESGNYRGEFNPTYYTRVSWPMLEAWSLTDEPLIRDAAVRVLERLKGRVNEDGSFRDWGFASGQGAFTHTIAYTLRGFLESGRALGRDDEFLDAIAPTVERLYRISEIRHGRLPGFYDVGWRGSRSFVCLTGNAQIALVLLRFEAARPDLRLVNAATKLIDFVCERQVTAALRGKRFKGAIAGSSPIWGPYLRLRYPNWAAKFFADSLMLSIDRLNRQRESARK